MKPEPIRILLVEDNPGDVRLLREHLSEARHTTFELGCVERLGDALAMIRQDAFDVVLLDLSLPDSFGLETLLRLREGGCDLPVVVLTGMSDEGIGLKAVQEGAQDYLLKGQVDGNLLARSLRYAIERHRMLSELEKARRLEHYVATHDMLTRLPNRQLFQDRLAQALAEARRHNRNVAVLFLDLDGFKNTNDTLGHSAGDRLLQAVARRLSACVRETDTVARFGGDEFTIVLTGITLARDAARVAQKLLDAFSRPFLVDGEELTSTASIGISVFPDDGSDAESLLRAADIAMYRAKSCGKNCYQFFLPEMNRKTLERLQIERNLWRALDRNEFVLCYQPQFDLRTGRVVSMEALVRWKHPDHGLLAPKEFIPLAEETGIIVPLGEWVLRAACLQTRLWREAGLPPVRVAANLSARQLQQRNLLSLVESILEESELTPDCLELELTESVLMEDAGAATVVLGRLRERGVRICVDDFGTGYSSLSYLTRFPVEKLKIDRLFVRNVTADAGDRAVTSAIVTLAHSLGLEPVAEGVETTDQLEALRELDCHLMQGYLLSPPLTAVEAGRLLRSQRPLRRLLETYRALGRKAAPGARV